MKIKVRKIVEEVKEAIDENTRKPFKYTERYENGFVDELEINPKDIGAFSSDKSIRLIGVGKNMYKMTLASYKETKKALAKMNELQKFNHSKKQ